MFISFYCYVCYLSLAVSAVGPLDKKIGSASGAETNAVYCDQSAEYGSRATTLARFTAVVISL